MCRPDSACKSIPISATYVGFQVHHSNGVRARQRATAAQFHQEDFPGCKLPRHAGQQPGSLSCVMSTLNSMWLASSLASDIDKKPMHTQRTHKPQPAQAANDTSCRAACAASGTFSRQIGDVHHTMYAQPLQDLPWSVPHMYASTASGLPRKYPCLGTKQHLSNTHPKVLQNRTPKYSAYCLRRRGRECWGQDCCVSDANNIPACMHAHAQHASLHDARV